MLELKPFVIANKLMCCDNLIDFLLENVEAEAAASELLSSILQACAPDYKSKFVLTLNGFEKILAIIAKYRKDRIKTEEEHEMLLNTIDCLAACLISSQENSEVFRKMEGYHLMINLLIK